MDSKLSQLMGSYREVGLLKGGNTVLLTPKVALQQADDLEKLGVPIVAVELWYLVWSAKDNREYIAEDPYGPSFDKELESDNPVQTTVAAAKRYIQNDLPERIVYVSFVLQTDERYWEAWQVASSSAG